MPKLAKVWILWRSITSEKGGVYGPIMTPATR